MKRIGPRKFVWLVPAIVFALCAVWAGNTSARPPGPGADDKFAVGNLLSDVQVPQRTSRTFIDLYFKHKDEIDRIFSENPFIIWESMGLVSDALPALKSVPGNGGRLYIDKGLFSKANDLFAEFEGLSSPALSHDLRQTWDYLQNRITPTPSGVLEIDLN